MSTPGDGYGSEHHLNDWLRTRPSQMNELVNAAIGSAGTIEWLPCATKKEWEGLDFVEHGACRDAWRSFWPQQGTPPTVLHLQKNRRLDRCAPSTRFIHGL